MNAFHQLLNNLLQSITGRKEGEYGLKKGLLFLLSPILLALLSGCNLVVFDPQGPQAQKLTDLINWSLIWIGLIVVVVLIMFIVFVWKYRDRPGREINYDPDEEGHTTIEIIWTVIPLIIVTLLLVPTVKVLFELEEVPEGYEDEEPLEIHVTSADWKWIFSYPEQNIETVNYVNIPVNRPIVFKLTSASTQQSFWIPSLAGQKYTMPNMSVDLIVVAEREGSYVGMNTNFNGEHYRDMQFEVLALSQKEFDQWVEDVQREAPKLTKAEYAKILEPSVLGQRLTYSSTHLEFIDHTQPNSGSEKFVDTERYLMDHEYPGRIFNEYNPEEHVSVHSDDEHGGGHGGH